MRNHSRLKLVWYHMPRKDMREDVITFLLQFTEKPKMSQLDDNGVPMHDPPPVVTAELLKDFKFW